MFEIYLIDCILLNYLKEDVIRIVGMVAEKGLPKGICLNVNFPEFPPFKGTKICRMCYGRWMNEVVKERHPRNYDYYWMVGEYVNDEPDAESTDQWALNHGYIAITPTQMDVTAYSFMKELESWKI